MTKSINDFNEDEKFQIVTSILEDITDKFWVVCERDRKVCIIGHNPDEMVYPPKRQYLNDRFNEIGWEHYTWN